MTAKTNPVASIRRDITRLVKELYALSRSSQTEDEERAWKLACAADVLIEALANELYRTR